MGVAKLARLRSSLAMNFSITIKWSGQEYVVTDLKSSSLLSELKEAVFLKTGVKPERQKLFGIRVPPKANQDGHGSLTLEEVKLKNGAKIMLMGSREEAIAAAQEVPKNLPEVVDEFDDIKSIHIPTQARAEFLAKVERRIREYPIKVMNEPRPGKKLLVLDVDGTLFDNWSVGETGADLMRPYLHEFLALMYVHYDLIIWSATNMKWIDAKLALLGVSRNVNYKFVCYLDSRATISVEAPKYGLVDTKPLGLIWGRFEEHYNASNTVIVDDCRHNFLMNPQNGIRIKCFRDAHTNRHTDKELLELGDYLLELSKLDTLDSVDHQHWKKFCRKSTSQ